MKQSIAFAKPLLLLSMLFILFATSANAQAVICDRGSSSYNVTIDVKTGNRSGAGTDSNIYMTIFGTKGKIREFRLNNRIKGDAFESGQLDRIIAGANINVGRITQIHVRSDDKYSGSDWYLEWVKVNGVRFNCNQWFENTAKIGFSAG